MIPAAVTWILTSLLAAQTSPSKAPDPNAPAKTPVTAVDLQIAERAANLLSTAEKWNRTDTGDCPAGAKTFSLHCSLDRASQEVNGHKDGRSAVMQEARITADLMAPKKYGTPVADFNNDSATTFQDIQEFFRILSNRLTRRMAQEAPGAALSAVGEGESESRLPVTEADIRIVRRAKEILDSPAKWNRADNRNCPAGAKTFSLYCALEKATQEISGKFEHRGAAMQEARLVIEDIAPNAPYYNHRLMNFNNDPLPRSSMCRNSFSFCTTASANTSRSRMAAHPKLLTDNERACETPWQAEVSDHAMSAASRTTRW